MSTLMSTTIIITIVGSASGQVVDDGRGHLWLAFSGAYSYFSRCCWQHLIGTLTLLMMLMRLPPTTTNSKNNEDKAKDPTNPTPTIPNATPLHTTKKYPSCHSHPQLMGPFIKIKNHNRIYHRVPCSLCIVPLPWARVVVWAVKEVEHLSTV